MDTKRIEHLLARRHELVTTLLALWETAEQGAHVVLCAEDALELERDINGIDEAIFQEVAALAPELAAKVIEDLDSAALLN